MNIFQNRLEQIDKKENTNKFKHRINMIIRQKHKIIKTETFQFEKFIFNGNLHSNLIENEKFTNYVKSYNGNTYFKILKELFDKLYEDNYKFFDEFQLEENNYSEISPETERLKRIIKEVNNINDVPKINEMIPVKYLKRKEKRYNSIRLFVNISSNGYIYLYLIDIYHLGINAYDYTTKSYNLDRNYTSNKDCCKCISKIADNYKMN